jgi:hypothetical protein
MLVVCFPDVADQFFSGIRNIFADAQVAGTGHRRSVKGRRHYEGNNGKEQSP